MWKYVPLPAYTVPFERTLLTRGNMRKKKEKETYRGKVKEWITYKGEKNNGYGLEEEKNIISGGGRGNLQNHQIAI
jgi:hypothetical protein